MPSHHSHLHSHFLFENYGIRVYCQVEHDTRGISPSPFREYSEKFLPGEFYNPTNTRMFHL